MMSQFIAVGGWDRVHELAEWHQLLLSHLFFLIFNFGLFGLFVYEIIIISSYD